MGNFTRIACYLGLFLALVAGGLFLQNWLQQQTRSQLRSLHEETIEAKQYEFEQAIARHSLTANSTVADFAAAATEVGATLEQNQPTKSTSSRSTRFSFETRLPNNAVVDISFPAPASTNLLSIYHRLTTGLLLLAPVFFVFGILIASIARRSERSKPDERNLWPNAKAEAVGMETLAKLSHEKSTALALEHEARVRIEQDLLVNRSLLDHSLEERIRLGRNLHDNICQTLYAVCLTLESVQKKNTLAPELKTRVDQCMVELKRVNQEVRAYLQELEPAHVVTQSFETALNTLLEPFKFQEPLKIETQLDADAVARIASKHTAEIMNIIREALSNALRHGHATEVSIEVASSNAHTVTLSIRDNGSGFTLPPGRRQGHGLANMKTRAADLDGTLDVQSGPNRGTKIVLTLPAPSTPT